MDMVERVARAIDPMAWAVPDEDYPAEKARREARQATSLMQARRSIEAMRTPTEDMYRAAWEAEVSCSYTESAHAWSAMIDAALKNKPPA